MSYRRLANWYETPFRIGYDQQLGRFHQVDALAEYFAGITPYHYSYSNPINFNDPTGLFSERDDTRPEGGQPAIDGTSGEDDLEDHWRADLDMGLIDDAYIEGYADGSSGEGSTNEENIHIQHIKLNIWGDQIDAKLEFPIYVETVSDREGNRTQKIFYDGEGLGSTSVSGAFELEVTLKTLDEDKRSIKLSLNVRIKVLESKKLTIGFSGSVKEGPYTGGGSVTLPSIKMNSKSERTFSAVILFDKTAQKSVLNELRGTLLRSNIPSHIKSEISWYREEEHFLRLWADFPLDEREK